MTVRARLAKMFAPSLIPAALLLTPTPAAAATQPAPATTKPAIELAVSLPAPGTPWKIMPLGDSITEGASSSTYSGYRAELYNRLVNAGPKVDMVGSRRHGNPDGDHEGHAGWGITPISNEVNGWLATYRPNIVLLHAGTNDLFGSTPEVAVARLSALIDQIKRNRPGVRIVVAKVIGGSTIPVIAQRTPGFQAAIPVVVASKGPNVSLVDMSMVGGVPGDMADDIHPSDVGYSKMAFQWYRALERLLNKTGTPWPVQVSPFARRPTVAPLTRPSRQRCVAGAPRLCAPAVR